VELHRLSDTHPISNRQRPARPIDPVQVANQEIATPEGVLVFVQHQADVRAALEQLLIARRQSLVKVPQLLERRPAAEFDDDVVLTLRDDQGRPDRPAALGDDAAHRHVAAEQRPDRPDVHDLVAEDQGRLLRIAHAAGHAAVHAQTFVVGVHLRKKNLGRRKRVRVAEQEHCRGSGVPFDERVRPAEQAQTVRRLPRREVERFGRDTPAPVGQPKAQCRLLFDLLTGPDNRLADAAD